MADTPAQSFASIAQHFNELPNTRKLAVLVSLAAAVALVAGLFMWARTPDYRVLFSNLAERDGGAVVTALQQMNVPYKMAEGSGAILVPAEQVYDLRFRLASQGLPRGGAVGFELMDNAKLGMTQFQEQVAYQRALEGELARTIQALSPVESARVHLAIPKPSVFIRDKQEPSASVLVNLYAGRVLDVSQVNAIVHMVSSSVPELSPEHVTVVDQAGRLWTGKNNASSLKGLNANQLDYLQEVESYYAKRVESIVSPIVGDGNVRAEVRADLDFSESEQTSETYRPNPGAEQQAVRSRQSVQDVNGGGNQAGGIPGALSNQPPGPATAPLTTQAGAGANAATGTAQSGSGSRREENTVNFEVDRTIRHTKESQGRVKRLSVAVVVNYRQQAGQAAKPLAPDEMQQVTNLVREAMGFSQERGDTVNVVNVAFSEASKVEPADTPLWKDPSNVAFAKETLKNLLVIGLAFYLVFGVLRPLLKDWLKGAPAKSMMKDSNAEQLLAAFDAKLAQKELTGYDAHLASVRDFAKQNPKAAADIIKEWISKE